MYFAEIIAAYKPLDYFVGAKLLAIKSGSSALSLDQALIERAATLWVRT